MVGVVLNIYISYSLLCLSIHKNVKCSSTMAKSLWLQKLRAGDHRAKVSSSAAGFEGKEGAHHMEKLRSPYEL